MCNRRSGLLAGTVVLGLVALVWAAVTALSGEEGVAPATLNNVSGSAGPSCSGSGPGMANPAAVYCDELGYEYRLVDSPEGQRGVCALPGGSQCDEWGFLEGTCGLAYSYCATHGYGFKIKTDGMNPLSRTYVECTRGQQEVGAATELMGLSDQSTRGSVSLEANVDSPQEDTPAKPADPNLILNLRTHGLSDKKPPQDDEQGFLL